MSCCDWPPHRDEPRCQRAVLEAQKDALLDEVEQLREERQDVINCVNLYGDELLHQALDNIGFAPRETVDYVGPDPTVECAWPDCTTRLRKSAADVPQYCSKWHRKLSEQEPVCSTCDDRGVVYRRESADGWEPEDCPDCALHRSVTVARKRQPNPFGSGRTDAGGDDR